MSKNDKKRVLNVKAPAKINIFLEVTGKREDGYHNISSIMQTVSLFDELEISLSDDGKINLTVENADELLNDENIICKAAKKYFEYAKTEGVGVNVKLKKNIPILAGLGGGSSDAAATLRGLNELFDNRFSVSELEKIGARIGADVPFCVRGGTSCVSGIGEIVEPCTPLVPCYIVLAKNGEKLSTKNAYQMLDEIADRAIFSHDVMLRSIEEGDVDSIAKNMYNAFAISTPEDAKIKEILQKCGARGTVLSGSGPTVVGMFDDETKALEALRALEQNGISSFLTTPINVF